MNLLKQNLVNKLSKKFFCETWCRFLLSVYLKCCNIADIHYFHFDIYTHWPNRIKILNENILIQISCTCRNFGKIFECDQFSYILGLIKKYIAVFTEQQAGHCCSVYFPGVMIINISIMTSRLKLSAVRKYRRNYFDIFIVFVLIKTSKLFYVKN